MINRIKELCKKFGITMRLLESECGISQNGIARWETNRPSVDKILSVADYFGVSVDYLLTGRESELTAEDAALLRKWHSIDEFGRSIVQTILDGEVYRCTRIRDLEDKERIIPIMRSIQPASAGTGIEIGIADMEIVHIPDSPEGRRAAFIVAVSGDSMLPLYNDGDQLLIEHADSIDIGEIGIFVISGRGYVKKLGIGELISLNPSYENIPFDSSIVCNGKVIGILKKTDIK